MPVPLTFFLESLLVSLAPFEDVLLRTRAAAAWQRSCMAAQMGLLLPGTAQSMQQHQAAPRHQTPACCCCSSPQKIQA